MLFRSLVISVESVERFIAARNRPTVREAAARLGMAGPTIRTNFLDTGLLPYDGIGNHLRVDPGALDRIHAALLDTVADIIERHGPITRQRLANRFNTAGHPLLKNRVAKPNWIEHWTAQIVEQGRVTRRLNGTLATNPAWQPPADPTASDPIEPAA